MHLVSHAVWSLVGTLACLGSVANAAGELEVGVVFPRNETYAPTDVFPIVFALKNAELAKNLRLRITSSVRNGPELETVFGGRRFDLANANFSTEPYFVYEYVTADTEGPQRLVAHSEWVSCDESGNQVSFIGGNSSYSASFNVDFTIKKGGQEVDLVDATADDTTCTGKVGFTLNVTDETHELAASGSMPASTCAVLDSPFPTTAVGPCRVRVDEAAEASMLARVCSRNNPPTDCPGEGSAVQQLATAGIASFAAVFGVIGFLLI